MILDAFSLVVENAIEIRLASHWNGSKGKCDRVPCESTLCTIFIFIIFLCLYILYNIYMNIYIYIHTVVTYNICQRGPTT